MWLVNFNIGWGDKKNSSMMFVEDLNTEPELDPKQCDDLPRAECTILDRLADKYGYDEEAFKALGEAGRGFPTILAVECKPGWMEKMTRMHNIGGVWIRYNDTEAIKTMYQAATANSTRVEWDEKSVKANRDAEKAAAAMEYWSDPNKYWPKRVVEQLEVVRAEPYEVMRYLGGGYIIDHVEGLAQRLFETNGSWGWKDQFNAINHYYPEVVQFIKEHGMVTRKDYIARSKLNKDITAMDDRRSIEDYMSLLAGISQS